MSFFKEVYNQVFGGRSPRNEVILHEVLHRSKRYQEDYHHWKNSYKRRDLVQLVADAYQLKLRKIQAQLNVHVLQSNLSNGFAVSYDDEIGPTNFQFLFEFFSDRILEQEYRRANADTTVTAIGEQVETVEKYYLKPKVGQQSPFDQRFGNVLIEHVSIDGYPSYVKLLANTYSDRNYKNADSFEKLADFLFSNDQVNDQ